MTSLWRLQVPFFFLLVPQGIRDWCLWYFAFDTIILAFLQFGIYSIFKFDIHPRITNYEIMSFFRLLLCRTVRTRSFYLPRLRILNHWSGDFEPAVIGILSFCQCTQTVVPQLASDIGVLTYVLAFGRKTWGKGCVMNSRRICFTPDPDVKPALAT